MGTPPEYLRHIANTAGAARFPESRLDLIRIGLGLYGLDASGTLDNLQPIGRFHTRVSHLHVVPAGEPVGYGAKDIAESDRMIATLPVGYADGLPRSAGMGRARLHAAGRSCPTVGPVCMDGCMIDVTGLAVAIGDSVEIFGDLAPIENLAKATDTIPYELLCRIPERVRRRHLRT
jgi:alanine racemase